MNNQDYKTIFITGASSGLGRATAQLFASKGWKVIASMRDPKKEKELGTLSRVTLMALDVTDAHQIESVAEQVVASGSVDVVFNNAGYGLAGALEGLTDDQILRLVNTNMLGTIRTTVRSERLPDGQPQRAHHDSGAVYRRQPRKGYLPSSTGRRQRMDHKASAQSWDPLDPHSKSGDRQKKG